MKNRFPVVILLVLPYLLLFSTEARGALCVSLASGNWTNSAIWSCGAAPNCGDSIVIEAGHTVTITTQQNYNSCGSPMKITIKGTLKFTNGNKLQLPCNSRIYVYPGGSIQPGTGGGNSNLIEICNTAVWSAGDGPYTGPACLPQTPCPSNLPVELSSFTATVKGSVVNLLWTTQSEKNNKQFDVERSADAVYFDYVTTVKSKAFYGNSSRALSYECTDISPLPNTSYYRLKQIDIDSRFEYSNIISVTLIKDRNIRFVIYPNPNQGEFTADVSGVENNHQITIQLADYNGKVVYQSDFFMNEAHSKFSIIPENKLTRGVYICSLIIEEIAFNVKVVVN